MTQPFRIGTRGSPLALAQAHETERRLKAEFPELDEEGAIEIVIIKTTGDMVLDRALADVGGKGLFTKEIDEAMLRGDIDIAVHSMKDVPTWLPDGIHLPCMFEREDTRDVFISNKATNIWDLPQGATVGSASLRRQAQIKHRRPDLNVVTFRGNVQTRLKKLEAGEVDGTLLALAGLNRLGLSDVATQIIGKDELLPAVGQGAIGVTCMEGDARANGYVEALNHEATFLCVSAERAFLAELDGSCRTPIAAQAVIEGSEMIFEGLIARPDGAELHRTHRRGPATIEAAEDMGHDAGNELKAFVTEDFFVQGA